MRILISTGLLGTLLAACGGSGGSSGEPVPTTVSRNTPAVGWSCFDEICSISYADGMPALPMIRDPDLAYGVFVGAGSSSGVMLFGSEISTMGPSSSTHNSVALIRDQMGGTGVLYSREGDTVLPVGGVLYLGDYVGLVTNAVNDNVIYIINGDANLDVDFAGGDILGSINNRNVLGPSGEPALGVTTQNVFLVGSVDSQGLFSGVTFSGDITAFSVTDAQDGTFDGLIAGPTGEFVVGGLDFVHERTGDNYLEVGAFRMTQD